MADAHRVIQTLIITVSILVILRTASRAGAEVLHEVGQDLRSGVELAGEVFRPLSA